MLTTSTETRPVRGGLPAQADPYRSARGAAITTATATTCLALAAYTGLRMPSGWAVTLQALSWQDGIHRRFLVGTLVRPLAAPLGHPYALYAGLSFLVLAALLGVLAHQAVTTRNPARRMLVLTFLLLPTGGYLFHEVGYFDQFIYVMLFGALALLARGRVPAAALLLAATPAVHEIALVTVLPVFFVAAVSALSLPRAILAVLPASAVGLAVLAMPTTDPRVTRGITARLAEQGFPVRPDALELFTRTQAESYRLFDPLVILQYVAPAAVVLACGTLAFGWAIGPRPPAWTWLAAAAAISPAALALGGWDQERWVFLMVANFCVVLWLRLDDVPSPGFLSRPVAARASAAMLALLVVAHVPLTYFDGYVPRPLTGAGLGDFTADLRSGDLFAQPAR